MDVIGRQLCVELLESFLSESGAIAQQLYITEGTQQLKKKIP